MEGQLRQDVTATCLIISANQVVIPYPVYPLGAAYVVGALTRSGHEAHHFDILADGGLEALTQLLKEKTYDLIGVSIRNLDSVDSADPEEYLEDISKTVCCVRENSSALVVLGGPAFSIMPEKLMDLLQADYGVVGEGEVVLPWLASELIAGRTPDEKIIRADLQENVWKASLLTPSTVQYYTDHGGMLNVQTKRGCPYNCSYCSYPTIEGKKIRHRDPEEVVADVMELQANTKAKYLFFTDSVFNDPDKKYLEVAEALIRKENTLPWCAFFRPHDLSRDELRLLKRSGLSSMEMGTDAATDETLSGIQKHFSFEDVLTVHNRIVEEEIPLAHFIMFGGPNETEATLQQGLKNIEKLEKSVVFAYIGIRIFPQTTIYDRAIQDGVISRDQCLLAPQFYYSPEIDRARIEEAILDSFANKMDRIYPCHEVVQRIVMLHKMGQVGPLWDLLLKKR